MRLVHSLSSKLHLIYTIPENGPIEIEIEIEIETNLTYKTRTTDTRSSDLLMVQKALISPRYSLESQRRYFSLPLSLPSLLLSLLTLTALGGWQGEEEGWEASVIVKKVSPAGYSPSSNA